MDENSPEGPSNCNGGREISFGSGESVGSSRTLKEEKGEEHENFGPNAGVVVKLIDAESLETSEDDEDGGPTMVQGERKMDEELISQRFRDMVLLNDVVDVSYCGADKEGKDKCDDIVLGGPQIHVYSVENSEERKSPGNSVNDNTFAMGEELIDDGAEEENVD